MKIPTEDFDVAISSARFGVTALVLVTIALAATAGGQQDQKEWSIHDMDRPQPKVVEPGTSSVQERPGRPPSDAIRLFDGSDLSKWESAKDKGGPAKWRFAAGYVEVTKGAGDIQTKQAFGDVQLHVEWATPTIQKNEGQDRGNSGIFLMGLYELQVLDSYQSKTYPDGQAGAIYGQYPPLVNASRPPGRWQTYDVIFQAPRFAPDGKLVRPARMTVAHNGVVVQVCRELTGPTANKARPPFEAHADKLPLKLQDHDHPVRYRNIWVREL